MKKKIIVAAVAAIVAVGAAWNVNLAQKSANGTISDLTLGSIEAMAQCEKHNGSSAFNYGRCTFTGRCYHEYGASDCDPMYY